MASYRNKLYGTLSAAFIQLYISIRLTFLGFGLSGEGAGELFLGGLYGIKHRA